MYVDNQSKPYFSRPWMAYVFMYSRKDEINQCGGAIINEKYISNDTDNIVQLPPCNDAQHTYTFLFVLYHELCLTKYYNVKSAHLLLIGLYLPPQHAFAAITTAMMILITIPRQLYGSMLEQNAHYIRSNQIRAILYITWLQKFTSIMGTWLMVMMNVFFIFIQQIIQIWVIMAIFNLYKRW